FECLTGQPPFVGAHFAAVLAKILFEEPPDARSLQPEVPEAIAALIARMLDKEPSPRPRDPTAPGLELLNLEGLAEAASPPSPRGREPLGSISGQLQLVSVIIAAPRSMSESEETLDPEETIGDKAPLFELRGMLVQSGAQMDVLAEGVIVATLSRRDAV